jgi:hypothetical protein
MGDLETNKYAMTIEKKDLANLTSYICIPVMRDNGDYSSNLTEECNTYVSYNSFESDLSSPSSFTKDDKTLHVIIENGINLINAKIAIPMETQMLLKAGQKVIIPAGQIKVHMIKIN